MSKFYVQGSAIQVFEDDAVTLYDDLPVNMYYLRVNPKTGLYLEKTGAISVPEDIFGSVEKHADMIIDTFDSKPGNMGVLLSGTKGTGKTCTSKLVAKRMLAEGCPVIMVTSGINTYALAEFFQKINTKSMILFDEFDKQYGKGEKEAKRSLRLSNEDSEDEGGGLINQNGLLSLLDGIQSAKQLFMFVCNELDNVNEYLFNRPSRIYYHIKYRGLDETVVREYCEKYLENKEHIDDVIKIKYIVSDLSFDILKAVVEECNRYKLSPAESLEFLNITPANNDITYDIHVLNVKTGATWTTKRTVNVFAAKNHSYSCLPNRMGTNFVKNDADDNSNWYDDEYVHFRPDLITKMDEGIITYEENDYRTTLTPIEHDEFDYRKMAF